MFFSQNAVVDFALNVTSGDSGHCSVSDVNFSKSKKVGLFSHQLQITKWKIDLSVISSSKTVDQTA